MGKMHLDLDTADRIIAGLVEPVDAPPDFAAVVALIGAARGTSRPGSTAVASAPRSRSARAAVSLRPRLALLAAAAALAAMTGAAYAAGLPADAGATAHSVLERLDTSPVRPAPTSTPTAGTHGATGLEKGAQISALARGGNDREGAFVSTIATGAAKGSRHGKGARISALAHATTGTGGTKGAIVSAAASNGKSHAGRHGHNGHGSSERSQHRRRVRQRAGGAPRP